MSPHLLSIVSTATSPAFSDVHGSLSAEAFMILQTRRALQCTHQLRSASQAELGFAVWLAALQLPVLLTPRALNEAKILQLRASFQQYCTFTVTSIDRCAWRL